jgi:acyl-CoA dehydrogenase
MVNFSLTEDQRMIVDMARDFAKNEIMPKAQHYDETHTFPTDILKKAHELGLVNVDVPEEYGGGNMGPFETLLIAETLGYACPGITFAILTNSFATAPIHRFGSSELKKKWLSLICRERLLASFALTEPQSGSDLGSFKTSYTLENDAYIINGQKAWISGANQAHLYVVFAYPKGSQEIAKMSAFIVTADTPGVLKGKPEMKLGLKASDTAGVTFDNVVIPKDQLIGAEGDGYRIVKYSLARGRTGTAAIATGIQQRCVDECIAYSRTRFSGGKPIGDQPVIRQYIAEMQMAVEASRLATWRAGWKMAQGSDFSYEAALAKAFATSTAEAVTLKAVQIMGSAGVSLEYPIAKLVDDAKVLSILEGTTEIQKYLISDALYSKGPYPYFTE